MTFKQIEKTRNLLSRVGSVNGLREVQEFVSEVKAFYGDDFYNKIENNVL